MEYWGPRDDSVIGTHTALLEDLDSIPSTPISTQPPLTPALGKYLTASAPVLMHTHLHTCCRKSYSQWLPEH